MWTVIYFAKDKGLAEKLRGLLEERGVISKIRPISRGTEKDSGSFEVLVPSAEIEEAHDVIIDMSV